VTDLLFASYKKAKRFAVGLIGFTVLLLGLAMIVLPGPAMIVIPIGLAMLATEFVWAKRLLKKVKEKIDAALNRDDR